MNFSLMQLFGLVVSLVVLGASLLLAALCYVSGKCSDESMTGCMTLALVVVVLSAVVSVGVLLA
jgi:hypothetical protein